MIFYTNMGNLSFKHTKLRKINSFLHLLKNAILHLSLFDRKATRGFPHHSSKNQYILRVLTAYSKV